MSLADKLSAGIATKSDLLTALANLPSHVRFRISRNLLLVIDDTTNLVVTGIDQAIENAQTNIKPTT